MKLAVLFPGIGYTCARPLLYYAGKLAAQRGYEVLPVDYGELPRDVKDSPERMRLAFDLACGRVGAALARVDWAAQEDVLFIGKSIGTAVATRYAAQNDINTRFVLLTPLAQTFDGLAGEAIAFHGTADPWADTGAIKAACDRRGIPLHVTEGANHSLETGDVEADIKTLADAMRAVGQFLEQR